MCRNEQVLTATSEASGKVVRYTDEAAEDVRWGVLKGESGSVGDGDGGNGGGARGGP